MAEQTKPAFNLTNESPQAGQLLTLALEAGGIGAFEWLVGENHIQAYWTPEFAVLYGLSRQTPPAYATWRAHLHPDDLSRIERRFKQALAGRQPYRIEFRIIRPDGGVRWVRARAQLAPPSHPALKRLVGVNIDITDLKELEHQLKAANDRMTSILEEVLIPESRTGAKRHAVEEFDK